MRVLVLASCGLLSACSFLDQISVNSGPKLDPNKVYLGDSTVRRVRPHDLDRYACVDAPLICEQGGTSYECRCAL